MARQVNHLSDIPDRRKFGSKYGGKKFKRHSWTWGSGGKRRLKKTAKRLKDNARISNYRIISYENVSVTKEKTGQVRDKIRKVWVLYIRK